MTKTKFGAALLAAVLLAGPATAFAAGDLATKATKLPDLLIGGGAAGYDMSQKTYDLESGKAYKLKLKATGTHACTIQGQEFFTAIYIRQIAAGEAEILNPTLTGLDFDDPSEAELFFVPVRTGSFKLGCKGLEEKGMTVTINVK